MSFSFIDVTLSNFAFNPFHTFGPFAPPVFSSFFASALASAASCLARSSASRRFVC